MLLFGAGWYWWGYLYPLKEFRQVGDIHFPDEAKTIHWRKSGLRDLNGRFQIPYYQVEIFLKDNQLTDGGNATSGYLVADRCIHGGKNYVSIRFEKESGIADISVRGVDHAGQRPCDPDLGKAP